MVLHRWKAFVQHYKLIFIVFWPLTKNYGYSTLFYFWRNIAGCKNFSDCLHVIFDFKPKLIGRYLLYSKINFWISGLQFFWHIINCFPFLHSLQNSSIWFKSTQFFAFLCDFSVVPTSFLHFFEKHKGTSTK